MTDGLEPEPAAAAELFGEHLDAGRAFTAALARHGEELGLIGPLELPRLWTRHVLNSALVAPLLRPGRVGDVGSGAGLPGLVLAIIRPDVSFTLIEPMERRVAWLERQVDELELAQRFGGARPRRGFEAVRRARPGDGPRRECAADVDPPDRSPRQIGR